MSRFHIDRFLQAVIKQGASDGYLVAGQPPALRIARRMRFVERPEISDAEVVATVKVLAPDRNQKELTNTGSTTFAFRYGDHGRFRVQIDGRRAPSLALRRVSVPALPFDEQKLPGIWNALIRRPRGLILVGGPVGGGKTSLLASMIAYINAESARRVVTIEQPIECTHAGARSVLTQLDMPLDVPDWSAGIEQARRSHADVILLGSLPEPAAVRAAVDVAHHDCLVLAEVGGRGAIDALVDVLARSPQLQRPELRERLGQSLVGVICQELCAGVHGVLVPAREILIGTPAVAGLIRDGALHRIDAAIDTGAKFGMCRLDDHLFQLYCDGIIPADEAADRARDPGTLLNRIDDRDQRKPPRHGD